MVVVTTIVLVIVFVLGSYIVRKHTLQVLMEDIESQNYASYYRTLESFLSKLCFSFFERENMKLTGYLLQQDHPHIQKQLQLIHDLRLKKQSKLVLAQRGFYYYIETKQYKQAKSLLEYIQKHATEKLSRDLEMQYSILVEKKSQYIQSLEEKIQHLSSQGPLNQGQKAAISTLEYLIGLQYMYLNDKEQAKSYFEKSLKHNPESVYREEMERLVAL